MRRDPILAIPFWMWPRWKMPTLPMLNSPPKSCHYCVNEVTWWEPIPVREFRREIPPCVRKSSSSSSSSSSSNNRSTSQRRKKGRLCPFFSNKKKNVTTIDGRYRSTTTKKKKQRRRHCKKMSFRRTIKE
jgi:hypothetical protein